MYFEVLDMDCGEIFEGSTGTLELDGVEEVKSAQEMTEGNTIGELKRHFELMVDEMESRERYGGDEAEDEEDKNNVEDNDTVEKRKVISLVATQSKSQTSKLHDMFTLLYFSINRCSLANC
ncbi:hypothetical protein FXO38_22580 [Capsicum annuum]|nr:hypothetical protein FXO38_22580 [Capsicum annuum]KAF3665515.1 hypothetical protein FXO37_10972 [Capsicum annuum]